MQVRYIEFQQTIEHILSSVILFYSMKTCSKPIERLDNEIFHKLLHNLTLYFVDFILCHERHVLLHQRRRC